MVELSDLDPYAVIVPLASTSARPFSPPARHASPLDFDLLQLDDPLSSHVAAEQQRRQSLSKSTEQKKRTVSPSRTLLRRSSTTAPSSNEAILFHPSSSPPASASLSAIRSSSSARIPHRPTPRHADTSFSDFQSAPSPSTSLDSNSKGKLGASIKQTWSSLKTTSRPALANLFAEPSSYFDEPNNERAASWPSSPQRYASPTERAKPPAITLRGVRAGLKSTLTEDLAEAIRPTLPPRERLSSIWSLLYSLDQHGVSLSTLYKRMHRIEAPCVLVVRDTDGGIFGAYLNEPLKRSDGFYGSGECFLWKALPFEPGDFRVGIGVKTFKWTGRNTYCILSNDEYISVGGGDGKYGLWIDSDLAKGVSARCPAFDNDTLCTVGKEKGGEDGEEASCEVLALEIWRIAEP